MPRIDIAEEVTPKKAFVWAVDWPGWCRSGKDRDLAIGSLLDHSERYAKVAKAGKIDFPAFAAPDVRIIESIEGGVGTEFGVPSAIIDLDRREVTRTDAERLASLVEAAWTILDGVAAKAPPTLRKGPRGGGRDTAKVIDHVVDADHAYAREIGVRLKPPSPDDREAVRAERVAMLEVLCRPSDGAPLAERKWTLRYAARRIAWHAFDHAWGSRIARSRPNDAASRGIPAQSCSPAPTDRLP